MRARSREPPLWHVEARLPFRTVLDWALANHGVDRLLCTTLNAGSGAHPHVARFVRSVLRQEFAGSVRHQRWTLHYPGVRLFGDIVKAFVVELTPAVVRRLRASPRMVKSWSHYGRHPYLESPCLFRAGERWPVFVSVVHHGDASAISPYGGLLPGAVADPTGTPEELDIPRNPYFVGRAVTRAPRNPTPWPN